MKKKSFEELQSIAALGMRKAFGCQPNPPSDEMVQAKIDGLLIWHPMNGLKIIGWLSDLLHTLEDIVNSPSDRLFILANGLLDSGEICSFLEFYLESLDTISQVPEVVEKLFGDPEQFHFKELASKLPVALETLKEVEALFTKDEKTVIRFLRHGWCHPTLNHYEPQIIFDKKKNRWIDKNKGRHLELMRCLNKIDIAGIEFKNSVAERLATQVENIKAMKTLAEELTFRFGRFKHEIFETWFNEPR